MLRLVLGVFLGLLASGCYTLEQAFRFNNAFNSRVAVNELLAGGTLPGTLAAKLHLSREVVMFAEDQGLNTGRAYQHFIPEESSAVSYLVSAAYADRFEAKSWWFPLVGRVPYLGFFEVEDRDREAAALRAQGFDVSIGTVGAFSSLGWFADPIYASMTKRSDPEFIQLILHELVHRTFWSRGSVNFNENLAEYVSQVMTELFLQQRRGGAGLADMKATRADQELFRTWLQGMRNELETIYGDRLLTREDKLKRKQQTITLWRTSKFPAMQTRAYQNAGQRDWNNAMILGASLYSPDLQRFERAAACVQAPQMGDFLAALRRAERRTKDAEKALDLLCSDTPPQKS